MSLIETFESQIARNKRNSTLIMACLVLLMTIGGFVGGGALFDGDLKAATLSAIVTAIGTGIGTLVAYQFGDGIILGITGARKLQRPDDLELFNVVEEVSIAAGIQMPDTYIIEDESMNAFATGRDPRSAAIAITSGLRKKLSRDELQGVIAHEIAHIINYDIRLMMVSGVIGGAIAFIADVLLRSGSHRSRGRNRSDGGGGGVFFVLAIIFAVLAPVVARLLQLAMSREREFLADSTAVRLTRNPDGLIGALSKLSNDPDLLDCENRAIEHMYVVSPTRKLEDAELDTVWSTHPPINDRIHRLDSLRT